jgi:predicted  nucleic acid-binding Zn-ribbon protein
MSQISNLFRLQQIDSQLDISNAKLIKIETVLLDDITIQSAKHTFEVNDEIHKALLKKLRESENKTYDTRIKIELSEASLYGGKIHNPKELQELQTEIASLKRMLTSLEDKQLEIMMEVEEAEEKLMWANEGLIEAEKLQIERNAEINGEKTKLLGELERLDSERKAALPTIPAADLGLYDQLRKSRNGVAVAKINARSCSACGTTLTAALVQAAQSTGQLIRCPSCSRILYPG